MFRFESELVKKFIEIREFSGKVIEECPLRWGNIDLVEIKFDSIQTLSELQIDALENKENLLIFSLLYMKRPHTLQYISKKLAMKNERLLKRIEMLIHIGVISKVGELYTIENDIKFPDVTIVSYEMKLTDIRKALNQAVINKKYSEYSYVVMPMNKYDLCLSYKEYFQRNSIGLILVDTNKTVEAIRPKMVRGNNYDKLISKIKMVSNLELHSSI